jgi:GNAT superfamily N-acetyltransferase
MIEINLLGIEIRAAWLDDKEAIQEIYGSLFGPDARLDEAHLDQLIYAGGLLVTELDGQVIGFGGIDVSAAEQINWLYLLPAHQGFGVGSEILQRLEAIGWSTGLNSLRLHSAPGAVEFYRQHGYRPVEAAEQHGHDHEGVEMVKERGVAAHA